MKHDIGEAHKQYIRQLEHNIRSDPSSFWKYLANKKAPSVSSQTFLIDGEDISDPQTVSDAFAEYFENSYIISTLENFAEAFFYDEVELKIDSFSEAEVLASLARLQGKLTAGPDQIPSFLLRDCRSVFVKPLTIIFNLCLETSTFPERWKLSKIRPVFKKGDKTLISNYRPITIISNFSKVFEHLLYQRVYAFFETKLVEHQHGFVAGRSTVTNLFTITQFISQSLDDGAQCDVVYTDLSKAFDQIDHGILLSKLRKCGFSRELLSLFVSYFTARKQFVLMNGYKSHLVNVTSGVPQGSILGPLFFNIFINDIASALHSDVHCLLYADDLKMYSRISSVTDCLSLQSSLDGVARWCTSNRLSLNAPKCQVMSFALIRNGIEFDYYIGEAVLMRPDAIRDLGVTFDRKLSFVEHVNNVTSSAYRSLGFIIRNSRGFCKAESLVVLFNTFVRSHLEYAAVVWEPCYGVHIERLESVQRRFLKFLSLRVDGVYPCRGYPHDVLLKRHNFLSLADRRQYMLVLFLHKVVTDKVTCAAIKQMLQYSIPRAASRVSLCFYLPTPRTNKLKFSPLYRMCDAYHRVQPLIDVHNCTVASLRQLMLS